MCFSWLFGGLGAPREELALALQCVHAVTNVLFFPAAADRLDLSAGPLTNLAEAVEKAHYVEFFRVFNRLLKHHADAFDQGVVALVRAAATRIQTETKASRKKSSIFVSECWNLIKLVCEQADKFSQFLESIEGCIAPLFEYLKVPEQIDFDDDILAVITLLIQFHKAILPVFQSLLPPILRLYERHRVLSNPLMSVLGVYLLHGGEQLSHEPELLDRIMQVAAASLTTSEAPVMLNNAKGCLLTQLVLQTVGSERAAGFVPAVAKEALKRLDKMPMAEYLQRQLWNVLLCAMCNNGQIVLAVMEEEGKTEFVVNNLLQEGEKASESQSAYDRKVTALGLSAMLMQPTYPDQVVKRFPQIFALVAETLYQQSREELRGRLKVDSEKIGQTQYGDDSDSDSKEEMDTSESNVSFPTKEDEPREGPDFESSEASVMCAYAAM